MEQTKNTVDRAKQKLAHFRDQAAFVYLTGIMPTHLRKEANRRLVAACQIARGNTCCNRWRKAFDLRPEVVEALNMPSHPMVRTVETLDRSRQAGGEVCATTFKITNDRVAATAGYQDKAIQALDRAERLYKRGVADFTFGQAEFVERPLYRPLRPGRHLRRLLRVPIHRLVQRSRKVTGNFGAGRSRHLPHPATIRSVSHIDYPPQRLFLGHGDRYRLCPAESQDFPS